MQWGRGPAGGVGRVGPGRLQLGLPPWLDSMASFPLARFEAWLVLPSWLDPAGDRLDPAKVPGVAGTPSDALVWQGRCA